MIKGESQITKNYFENLVLVISEIKNTAHTHVSLNI